MTKRRPGSLAHPWRLAAALASVVLLALAFYASTFVISYEDLLRGDDPLLATDVGRLAPARVERVDEVREMEQLRAALRDGVISDQPIRAKQLRDQ
jgi:hypothetical protein